MSIIHPFSPRIVMRLKGGLGNQLFMYAFAKAVSVRNDIPFTLDVTSGFARDRTYRREYLLHHFNIEEKIASDWDSYQHFLGKRRRDFIIRCNGILPLRKKSYISERTKGFDEEIHKLFITRSVYFDGYWQSYKYFESIQDIIRDHFRIQPGLDLTKEHIAEARSIESCNSVCLGVRRFADVPMKKRFKIQTPGFEYYEKAMSVISGKVSDPHFFIFTQDREWAGQYLTKLPYHMTFIQQKNHEIDMIIDLWLMTLCKHFIIPNSTYHWWGAWLAGYPDKIIIAPENEWVQKDIIPPGWMTIDTLRSFPET